MFNKLIRTLLLLALMSAHIHVIGQSVVERPKLIVGVVLDQMRWDYLYRYYDRYQENGFKRLLKNGFNCQNTQINYLPTFTAPGHASIYTGTVPALHGIAGNDWINNNSGKKEYCTDDPNVVTVGVNGESGKMSPKNLIASTITDELRLATNFQSRTFGISLKDRGAILPAGHAANAAYWFESQSGKFITSTHYMQFLPAWMQYFNKRMVADSLMKLDWNTLYPINAYTQSEKDNNQYEGKFTWEEAPVFPHKTSNATKTLYSDIRFTPYGNTLITMLAKEIITNEAIGQKNATDFLAISYSGNDYIGHMYAPNSIEIEDTYLRMDAELAELLQFLDHKIGKNNYLLFLTADHGGAHNAAYQNDKKLPAGNMKESQLKKEINEFLNDSFQETDLVLSLENYQVYYNWDVVEKKQLDINAINTQTKKFLSSYKGVHYVIDMLDIDEPPVQQLIRERVVNGYYKPRSGHLQIVLEPGWYSGYGISGTTHGGWHPYDSKIPLIFYGWGIPKGETFRTINITDIAPTLAALLKIQVPNACIGEPITEITK